MLRIALIVFAIGAIGGMVLASFVLRGRLAPWAVSILHALIGATGIAVLLTAVVQGTGTGRATVALGLFVLAALGGFYLAAIHMRGKVAPKAVVLVHASVAVVAFLTLLTAVLAP
jgi:hypothetical protein